MSEAAGATGTVESFLAPQDEKTVTWGEAQFTINKMLPMEAKAIFVEHVQPLMHQVMRLLDEVQGDGDEEDVQFVVSDAVLGKRMMKRAAMIFSALPPKHYRTISVAMSKSIQVRRGSETRFLAGNEEWAFQGLEGAHAIMLDGRAFLINFTGWLPVILSEFPSLMQVFASQSRGMSTPSSETS